MCLFDERRVEHFRRAILDTVRPGDIVVDAGSGTGLLGMFAAVAGAARVYCVEISPGYIGVIEENARRNGLDDRIVVIHADATTVVLPEDVDVIVCEVLSAGLFYEPQLQIIENLRAFLRSGGSIIPSSVENYVDLVRAQDTLYGLKFDYEPRWKILDDVALTNTAKYLHTDFYVGHPSGITADVPLYGEQPGAANAIRISYNLHLTDTIQSNEPTDFMLNPQIIFLPEPLSVSQGQAFTVELTYEAGCNPRACEVVVEMAHSRPD
jgi:predicted RNA methylase